MRAGAPQVTYALIGLNIIVFFAELAGGGAAEPLAGGGRLISEGGLSAAPVADGQWYRILTSGFLHAGPLHLLLNMFVLYILGSLLEPALGTARLLALYATSLLAGSLGALLADPHSLTVGASGAVFGLMAAGFVIARRRGIEQLATQLGIWLALNIVFTLSVPGISIGGHLGGLVGGAVAALIILAGEHRRTRSALTFEAAGLGTLGMASFAAALLVASAAA